MALNNLNNINISSKNLKSAAMLFVLTKVDILNERSNNNAKFEMLKFDHDKELNYALNLEGKKSIF